MTPHPWFWFKVKLLLMALFVLFDLISGYVYLLTGSTFLFILVHTPGIIFLGVGVGCTWAMFGIINEDRHYQLLRRMFFVT